MENIIISISYVFACVLSIVIYEFFFRKIKTIDRNTQHQGWISLKDEEIPGKINGIILTDGKRVTTRSYDVDYNRYGQPIIGYPPQPVTHWMLFPAPPKINKEGK